jgi:hypothetical protein
MTLREISSRSLILLEFTASFCLSFAIAGCGSDSGGGPSNKAAALEALKGDEKAPKPNAKGRQSPDIGRNIKVKALSGGGEQ